MLRTFLAAVLAIILLAPSPARAADHIAIDAQFVGLDAMTAFSPTDAFLRDCFKAIGPRILQIPGEVGEGDPQEAAVIASFWESMRGSKSVRLVYNDDDPAAPRVRFLMVATPVEPEKAAAMARAMEFIAEKEGLPLTDAGPLRTFTAKDGTQIAFGVRDGAFALRINGLDIPREPAGTIEGAPADAPLLLRLHMSGPVISKLIDMAPQDDPADAAKGLAALRAAGLYGENAMSLDIGVWNVGAGLQGSASFRNVRPACFPGQDPPPTLGDAFLSMIPTDVTAVQATVADLGVIERMIAAADPSGRAEISAESTKVLGFDVWGDFLAHLGPRYAWYQSERTGGAGAMSTVMLAEVKDPAAFGASHAKLVQFLNGFGAGMAKGYVRIDTVDVGGQPAFLLHAPGLPLPIAPMWAIVGNTVIAGATPVAFTEALAIAKAKGPSIATNFNLVGSDLAGFAYCDTPRLARTSMGAGTGMLIMLANATRTSPASTAPALPGASAFLDGVRPCNASATWAGNDVVWRWTCDESLTVLGAVMVKQYAGIWGVQAMTMLSGISNARAVAGAVATPTPTPGVANVRTISIAIVAHCAQSGDVFPQSLETLRTEGLLTDDDLRSPFGPSEPPGTPDYVMHLPVSEPAKVDFPSETVFVVDAAAMRAGSWRIPIGMGDGQVREVTRDELDVLLNQPQNLGMRKALGID